MQSPLQFNDLFHHDHYNNATSRTSSVKTVKVSLTLLATDDATIMEPIPVLNLGMDLDLMVNQYDNGRLDILIHFYITEISESNDDASAMFLALYVQESCKLSDAFYATATRMVEKAGEGEHHYPWCEEEVTWSNYQPDNSPALPSPPSTPSTYKTSIGSSGSLSIPPDNIRRKWFGFDIRTKLRLKQIKMYEYDLLMFRINSKDVKSCLYGSSQSGKAPKHMFTFG